MKKILSLLIVLALCITSFGFVASATGGTDLVWSLTAHKSTAMTADPLSPTANYFYVAVHLDQNPGMAGQKFDLIFDPTVLTYANYSLQGDGVFDEELGETVYPPFVGKPYDKGTITKPGDILADNSVVTNFFRWIGGYAGNLSETGVFIRVRFNIKSTTYVGSTKIRLAVDPLQTARVDPQAYLTSNSPEIIVPLHGGYNLSFDKNTTDEVTNMPATQGILGGSAYSLASIATPVRTGYSFQGWSTDTTAANIITSATITTDKTLYAIWQQAETKYDLSFDKNTTDTVTNMPTVQSLTKDVAFDLSALIAPSRTGYTFEGWSTDTTSANIVSSITLTSAGKTLYAIWKVIPPTIYDLSFDKNTTETVTGMPATQNLTKDVAFDLTTLTAPARFGYTFEGWSTDTTAANITNTITLTDAGKTLYAIWQLKTHEVITPATSTRPGLKEIKDDFGNVISTEPIAMLPHFGTQRGLQVPAAAKVTDETTTVRLILGVNSLEYTKAGFVVAAQSKLDKDGYTPGDEFSVLINSTTVYESITTGGHTYTAADFGAKYLVVIEINNFPKTAYSHNVRFQGFTVTEDGIYHFDDKVITTVSTLFPAV